MGVNDRKTEENDSRHRGRSRRRSHSRDGNTPDRFWPFLAAAAAVILTAAIVFSAGNAARTEQAAAASRAAEQAEAEAQTETVKPEYELSDFEPCGIPEINILVNDYFDARLSCDTERLAVLFGRKAERDEELESRLRAQADWIQKFSSCSVYSVPGTEEGSRLCIVLYDIDFRRTDTVAPGVMYMYVQKKENGEYYINEHPVSEIYRYIEEELSSESALALINDSNSRLKAALDSDSTLALIYTSFRNGEIYKESEIDVDRDQEVDLFIDPKDSVLVDQEVLDRIKNEAASEAAAEESMAEDDAREASASASKEQEQ